jgi:hypothetical protein
MARLYLVIALIAVIAVAVLVEMQYEARRQLHSQSDSLREQFQRLGELEAENIRLSNIVARANTPLADEQLAELENLRQQVESLRHRTNEVASLQTEIRRLRSAMSAVGNTVAGNTPPDVPASDIYPRDFWTFVGYDTPENTIQSLFWAISNGDEDSYAAGLTPELRDEMQNEFGDGSFADEGPLESSDITGYRIVDRDVISDNEVTVTVFVDGENDVVPIVLDKTDGGWVVAQNGN